MWRHLLEVIIVQQTDRSIVSSPYLMTKRIVNNVAGDGDDRRLIHINSKAG